MLSLRSEAEDFPQSSAQARPTTPSAARSKVPSVRPYTGSYVAGRTTEQTQWFRFESCWSPPLGTASRPPIRSLPAHPTGVEPRLEPGEFYHSKADCVASQVRLFGTEVPEGINYAQKRKNSRGVLGLLNTAELCAGNTERKQRGLNQFREKLGGLRLLTGLALYKALGKSSAG